MFLLCVDFFFDFLGFTGIFGFSCFALGIYLALVRRFLPVLLWGAPGGEFAGKARAGVTLILAGFLALGGGPGAFFLFLPPGCLGGLELFLRLAR